MAEKAKETAIIIDQKELLPGIFDMWLRTEKIAKEAKAGQFVSVYCHDGSRILPRPISICEIDKEDGAIRLVYRVAGKGTEEFSKMRTGMHLQLVGPLGNGFPKKEKKAFLIGGGIGIPPMLELAKELNCEKQIILGFRDEMFLMDDLKKKYTVVVVTHNMQQAVRVSDDTAFFLVGEMVEFGDTKTVFSYPKDKRTEDYITGRFG